MSLNQLVFTFVYTLRTPAHGFALDRITTGEQTSRLHRPVLLKNDAMVNHSRRFSYRFLDRKCVKWDNGFYAIPRHD
jgi:hypothetical protein